MKNLRFVLKEHKDNLYKIWKLSWYDFITPFRDTYLGILWAILGPFLQISVYWVVFGLGIRGGKPVDGTPFLLWMLTGLIPWLFISGAISSGALSIYSKASMLTKMRFPTSIIPTYSTLTQLISNLPLLIILFVIYAIYGFNPSIYFIQIPYYLLAAVFIVIGFSLLTSALVMAARDVNRLVGTVLRFLFYLTPILWVPDAGLHVLLKGVIKINPFVYLIDGFRNSLIYNKWFFEDMSGTLYFWGLAIVIMLLGITVHMRLRNKFADLV
ncbi:MAG: ABC transporter permease [Clostridium sp.]